MISLILPVFNNFKLVQQCINSILLSRNKIKFQIIVIDDASTEFELKDYLRNLESKSLIKLFTNKENLKFTKTVNFGMKLNGGDILLLNSDTIVFGNWLDRLTNIAYRNSRIATVTPLSNYSHISSYPNKNVDFNPRYKFISSDIDKAASICNKGKFVYSFSGVGFCLFIKRECINEIGLFDSMHFPKGYGEETDFCARASKLGWKHAIAADTFVEHIGGQSFKEEKFYLMQEMLQKIYLLHPDLKAEEDNFTINDPLKRYRMNIDIQILSKKIKNKKYIHLHNQTIYSCLLGFIFKSIYLEFDSKNNIFKFPYFFKNFFPNLPMFNIPNDIIFLIYTLKKFGVIQIVVNSYNSYLFLKKFNSRNHPPLFVARRKF